MERRSLVIAAILVSVTIVVLVSGTIVVHCKHGAPYEYEILLHEEDKPKTLKQDTDDTDDTDNEDQQKKEKAEEEKDSPNDTTETNS